MHHAEAGKAVARVFRPAQEREQILDVRGLEKLQAAVLDEGDVAPGQFHFERAAVVRRAEQHGLRLERKPRLAACQDRLHHVARLVRLVAHADDLRALGGLSLRPEILGEALCSQADDRVRRAQDRLRGAVVLLQRDDIRRRRKWPGKSRMLRTVAARNE